jgi:DivIVA domain-containing protein
VELDRQSIEKRDFPIGRRGYDPAAVDAHLRMLATEVQELRYALESSAGETLGSSAGTQVQGILEAAEATAAEIERKAAEDARQTRTQADADAERTRADAIARAQAHVAAVAEATAVLSERVESMDARSAALVESLRAGASRLAEDLSAVETNMAELYDAAAGRAGENVFGEPSSVASSMPVEDPAPASGPGANVSVRQGHSEFISSPPAPVSPAASTPSVPASAAAAPAAPPVSLPPAPPARSEPQANAGNGDLDGARLIALNMALNGDSRAATDRYLAEHYELTDRQKLLDEVFAAVEG